MSNYSFSRSPFSFPPVFIHSESIPSSGLVAIGCLAKDVVPPVISFTWDHQNVSINPDSIKQFPSVFNPVGTFSSSSQVVISAHDWWNFQPFYCRANNTNGTGVIEVIRPTSCLQPEMIIRAPRLEDFENSNPNATIVCMAVNLRTARATVQWQKNGHVLNSGFATTGPAVMECVSSYSIVCSEARSLPWPGTGCPFEERRFSHRREVQSENFTSTKNISKPLVCDLGPGSEMKICN
uniref:Uncharacterized protein n=1 Tax=Sphaerodactylus townsendi TaxID=933632 RepID=A0ACB8EWH4_9SAUR